MFATHQLRWKVRVFLENNGARHFALYNSSEGGQPCQVNPLAATRMHCKKSGYLGSLLSRQRSGTLVSPWRYENLFNKASELGSRAKSSVILTRVLYNSTPCWTVSLKIRKYFLVVSMEEGVIRLRLLRQKAVLEQIIVGGALALHADSLGLMTGTSNDPMSPTRSDA